jgi:hypothetical protein
VCGGGGGGGLLFFLNKLKKVLGWFWGRKKYIMRFGKGSVGEIY